MVQVVMVNHKVHSYYYCRNMITLVPATIIIIMANVSLTSFCNAVSQCWDRSMLTSNYVYLHDSVATRSKYGYILHNTPERMPLSINEGEFVTMTLKVILSYCLLFLNNPKSKTSYSNIS